MTASHPMKETSRNRVHKRAFTLIELLVVIAIISILAAILFPVFARARENARRSGCQSNMKQLALGVLQYTGDIDGRMMPYQQLMDTEASGTILTSQTNHFDPVQPYIKNSTMLFCPNGVTFKPATNTAANRDKVKYANTHYGFPTNSTGSASYMAPLVTLNATFTSPMLLDAFPQAARTCMIGETSEYGYVYNGTSPTTTYFTQGTGLSTFPAVTAGHAGDRVLFRERHFQGSNYAYLDGHVKWVTVEAVNAVYTAQGSTGLTEANVSSHPIVFAWKR